MLKAVQFGAGNIGRGFLGQLFFESGYTTTFVDVVAELVQALNARKSYPLRIVDDRTYTNTIENVSAVNGTDIDEVAARLAEADFAATAVGVPVMGKIAPLIAAGVERRFANAGASPLNIILCENMIEAGPFMREQVRGHLSPAFHDALDTKVGFVEASIGRMVPVMTDAIKAEDPLLVCVEEYSELPVDAAGFKGPIPALKNMKPLANFGAYVERKLFVHNAGHAVTAYLGYHRGHETIADAIRDEVVRAEVDATLHETCSALVAKHGLDPKALAAHAADLIRRFGNRALGDQVSRVAKDPIRKLGPRDRLIGSAAMCLTQGVEPRHVAFAAAAAIRYDHPDDAAAQSVQRTFRERGLQGVLQDVCGLAEDSPIAALIQAGMQRLSSEGWI
ncbi:MAG: mannitol-1-phosphate 5-dehydrogenase [Candidatus Hydrogenedentales bacterium]|jgi:mannitol-1-phosphate 5-dehydrogenase